MKKVAIRCTSPEQGAKIIEYLVGLGGRNSKQRTGIGYGGYYFINQDGVVDVGLSIPSGYTEIQLPTTPEIGPEGKLMWVWDGDGENPKTTKRIVIWLGGNRCMAINSGSELAFRAGDRIYGTSWDNCAEIEEPEQVELTMEEVCQKLGINVKIVKK
jgi:hypothetical protein